MKRSKAYIARKPVENPPTAIGSEANRSASGSIEKATVASRTPLANPSANDMKSVVGLTQSAIRPPIGEATAAAPAIPTMIKRSASPTVTSQPGVAGSPQVTYRGIDPCGIHSQKIGRFHV